MYDVYLDGQLIYSTSRVELQRGIVTKTCRFEVNKAGSFEFTVYPTHPAYSNFNPLTSVVTIEDDGEEIFRGRVLHNPKTFYGERTISCEGDLAYLNDSVYAIEDDVAMTVESFFVDCINSHNAQVDNWKQFTVGVVSIAAANQEVQFKKSSYQTTISAIEGELLKYYGGFIRTRRSGNVTYIDYLDNYQVNTNQPIQFSVNLLDLTEDDNNEEIYSVFVPVGKDNLTIASINGGSIGIANEDMVAQYGYIYKTESFSDIDNVEDLLYAGVERMARDVAAFEPKYTCKVLDLHLMYPDFGKLLVGYRVHITSDPQDVDIVRMILSADIDIQNPENSSYEIGVYSTNMERRTFSQKETGQAQDTQQTASKKAAADKKDKDATAKTITEVKYDVNRNAETITDHAEKISLIASDEELASIKAGDISSIYSQSRLELESTRSELYTNAQKITDTGVALMTAGVFNSITERKDENGKVIGYDVDSNLTAKKIDVDTTKDKVELTQAKLLEAGVFNHIDADGTVHTELVAKKSVVDATRSDMESTKRTLVEAGVYVDIDSEGRPTVVNKVVQEGKVITAINTSVEGVTIDAQKIDISGVMNSNIVKSMSLAVGGLNVTGGAILSGLTVTNNATISGTITGGSVQTSSGLDLGTHQHWVSTASDGTVTIGAPTSTTNNSSFNIADTSYYKNHVGVRSVSWGNASLVSNEWGGWDYSIPVTAYGNDNSSIDRTVTVSADDAVAQGVHDYYYSYGNWDYPRWDNNWRCTRPNSTNTGTELWFDMDDVLPDSVSWNWSWDTSTRVRCRLEICGKSYTDYYDI